MEKKYTELQKLSFLDNGIKLWKQITVFIVVAFILQGIIMYYMYTRAIVKAIDRVYIARDFSIDRVEDKVAMASGHVQNFYKLFFEIDAGNYKKNVSDALELVGESGKELAQVYANNKYYERIVSNNLWIGVNIDSIKILNVDPPFIARVYAKRVIRSAYGTKYTQLNSEMEVRQVSNTVKNPFGMMIENFRITDDRDVFSSDKY
jgi:hypothetical protein